MEQTGVGVSPSEECGEVFFYHGRVPPVAVVKRVGRETINEERSHSPSEGGPVG